MKMKGTIEAVMIVAVAIFASVLVYRLTIEEQSDVGFDGQTITTTQYNNETLAATAVNLTRNLTNTNSSSAVTTQVDRVILLANLTEGIGRQASLINFTINRNVNPNTINFSDIGFSNNAAINITYTVNRTYSGETGSNWTTTNRTIWNDLLPIGLFIAFIGLIIGGVIVVGKK